MMTSNAVLSNHLRRESNELASPFTLNFDVDCRRENLQTAGWTDPMGVALLPSFDAETRARCLDCLF